MQRHRGAGLNILGGATRVFAKHGLSNRAAERLCSAALIAARERLSGRGKRFEERQVSDTPADGSSLTIPDRLSVNPSSPYYNQAVLDRDVGVRFNGAEKTNVEEYCVSEGWVRLSAGNAKDRHGNAMTVKLKGKVEPYFRT